MEITFPPGTLVRARGREWVVLPEANAGVLMVKPLGGLDEEIVGISPAIEDVVSATFAPPSSESPGDFNSCRLLRDAARISTRAVAGPFRSFGRIAVEPRPYQLVPLLMALRLDPIRLLIADDVGIGKTIEASLIAKELLERGEVRRLAVLCPPQLAERWQRELEQKFHIAAEPVLTSTVQRLERGCRPGESLFERYPYVIVSTDFIKSPRRRSDFIRACPEFVIVDEAHTCTLGGQAGRARQARFELIQDLAKDDTRHLVLVTATPHSGNEEAFRSLLSLLNPKFKDLPTDLDRDDRESARAELARHLVQRLRGNIRDYLDSETPFPSRDGAETEDTYRLTPEYRALFNRVLGFVREMVADEHGTKRNRRVRWWSALALLRALASSPAAAAATLRNRAATADGQTEEEIEELGTRAILDQEELEISEVFDATPGADPSDEESSEVSRRLRRFAREAEELRGEKDAKLQKAIRLVKGLIREGHNPILFCRFIDTADYLAAALRHAIPSVAVESVTGLLPPKDREDRISALGEKEQRILVCTDCLSEGINLQDHFDAVLHYDLSWNPTRHEQREGRVDRFGQPKPKVRILTYFGVDNQIDGIVLDVLLRKHKTIKSALGISVAVPGSSEDVIKALFEGMQLRAPARGGPEVQLYLPGLDPIRTELHARWDEAKDREARSRSRFAQQAIKTQEVKAELESVREALGTGPAVRRFVEEVFHLAGVPTTAKPHDHLDVAVSNEAPRALRHAIGVDKPFTGRFDLPVADGVIYLSRTHPIVEGLASYVLDSALDEVQASGERIVARRSGVTKTRDVPEKTSILLMRFRFHLHFERRGEESQRLVAEEVRTLSFRGTPESPRWLDDAEAKRLLDAVPSGNLPAALVKSQLQHLLAGLGRLLPHIERAAKARADQLLEAHTRVRKAARMAGRVRVEPVLPADVLGCFILLKDGE